MLLSCTIEGGEIGTGLVAGKDMPVARREDRLEVLLNSLRTLYLQVKDMFGHVAPVDLLDGFKSGTLYYALITAAFTALIGLVGYLGKRIVEDFQQVREERKKFRSSLIRYVYDADIWKDDFAKRFSPREFDILVKKLIESEASFRFSFGASQEEGSKDIVNYIHWLRSREIYAIRLFFAYSDLFDSLCDALSSETFGGFDRRRKVEALFKTQQVGIDTYRYAAWSLSVLRTPDDAALVMFGRGLWRSLVGLFRPAKRNYLTSYLEADGATGGPGKADYWPPEWNAAIFESARSRAMRDVEAFMRQDAERQQASKKWWERLGHF